MPLLLVAGRVVFALYFIFVALQRLMNVAGTADFISHRIVIPAALAALGGQIESLVGLSIAQLIALLAGAIELAAGLLIAFNVGTRFMAALLIIFTALKIFYIYDFWAVAQDQREPVLILAVVHVSLIGGLLVLMGVGPGWRGEPERGTNV